MNAILFPYIDNGKEKALFDSNDSNLSWKEKEENKAEEALVLFSFDYF